MKIEKEELQQISEWIANQKINFFDTWGRMNKKNLYYDIQCEMVDHIASDIENLMIEEQLSFKQAFYVVQRKWSHNELKKLEIAKNKAMRSRYNRKYLQGMKSLILSPKIFLFAIIGIVIYKLLMIDEYWFSEVKYTISISILLFGLFLVLINMYQTHKINGIKQQFLLNGLSYRIIAVQTGSTAILINFAMSYFIEPMDFFNADEYDFHSNSIKLSIILTFMLIHMSIIYFVVHKSLKKDLREYVHFYS